MKTKNNDISVVENLNENLLEQLKGGKAEILAVEATPSQGGDGSLFSKCCNSNVPEKNQ